MQALEDIKPSAGAIAPTNNEPAKQFDNAMKAIAISYIEIFALKTFREDIDSSKLEGQDQKDFHTYTLASDKLFEEYSSLRKTKCINKFQGFL